MTRAHHVTHSYTTGRIERMRSLITALQIKSLTRGEIGAVLQMGPSGVRKYLVDLRGMFEVEAVGDEDVVRLAINEEEARAFLAGMAEKALARQAAPSKSSESLTAIGPGRHFHILADDTHYAIRVNRTPIVRDPLVAALFGARGMEARA
jgi:hypothetical protein